MMRYFLTVSDVMTKDVISVEEYTPFKATAAVLEQHHISAVPVRGAYGGIVGVVSETDLLRKEEFQRRPRRPWQRGRTRAKADAITAKELMSSPAVTIEAGCTLDEAARLMMARRITRLVVMNGGEPVGIVTRSDLLRAFLAPDQEILARVRRELTAKHLVDDPLAVQIEVREGVVTLIGQVPQRSLVGVSGSLVSDLDGVVGVRNELTWSYDDTAPATGPFY